MSNSVRDYLDAPDDFPQDADAQRFMEAAADKGNVAALKAFLSRQRDEARLTCKHNSARVPGQFVIVGTSGETSYLDDTTSNQRFWRVRVERRALRPRAPVGRP